MNLDTTYIIVYYASILSVGPAIVNYFKNFRNYPRHLHLIGILVCVSGIIDVVVQILLSYQKYQIAPVFNNAFVIIQFILLSIFYYEIYLGKSDKLYVLTVLLHCLFTSLLVYFFALNIFTYNGLIRIIGSIAFIIYSFLYLKRMFWVSEDHRLNAVGTLWINGAILIYFGIGIGTFLMRDTSITNISIETEKLVWIVHNICNIIKNLFFAKGLLAARRNLK